MLISQQVTGLTKYTCMEVANTCALHLVIIDCENWSTKRGYNSIKIDVQLQITSTSCFILVCKNNEQYK